MYMYAHRFADITVARLEDAIVSVSRYPPGGLYESIRVLVNVGMVAVGGSS